MPSWKKVITSGSSPHFTTITSSADISSSGNVIASNIYLPGPGKISFDDSLDGTDQYISGNDNNISIDGDEFVNITADDAIRIRDGSTNVFVSIDPNAGHITASGDISASGTVTAGGFTTTGTWTFDTSAGGTAGITNINVGSAFTDDDVTIMSAGAIKEKIENYGYTTQAGDITGVTAGTGMSGGGTTGTVTLNNAGVTSNVAGTGIGVSGATGAVTITNSGVTTNVAGALIDVDQASGDVTIAVDLSELTDGTDNIDSNDEIVYLDNSSQKRKAFSEIELDQFSNTDSGFTSNAGDITAVTAGDGIQGGGTTGGVTLNIDVSDFAGNGLEDDGTENLRVDISGLSSTLTAVDQADYIAVSDESATADETKKITFSNFEDEIFGNVSGDATIAAGGAVTVTGAAGNFTTTGMLTADTRKFAITSNTEGDYEGDVVYFGDATDMTAGGIWHYYNDGESVSWTQADADAEASCDGLLAVSLGEDPTADGMLLRGMVTLNHQPGTLADTLFVSTAATLATSTAPSGNLNIVRIIGYCLDNDNGQIWFNPDNSYIEISAG